jgi:hypothetical protein
MFAKGARHDLRRSNSDPAYYLPRPFLVVGCLDSQYRTACCGTARQSLMRFYHIFQGETLIDRHIDCAIGSYLE